MVVRCPKCGEALVSRADHEKGRYVYEEHNHNKQEDIDQQDSLPTLQEKMDNTEMVECPECDGDGWVEYPLSRCKKCYGNGKVAKSLAEKIEEEK